MMKDRSSPIVWLSAAQLAARYGVHIVTIWRWSQNGRLPRPHRISRGTTRWRKDEVETCEAQRAADMREAS
jgi:predicted DNA-binding transcriptional regulator AlpA